MISCNSDIPVWGLRKATENIHCGYLLINYSNA